MSSWTTAELLTSHRPLLEELQDEGLSITRTAEAVTEQTGRRCSRKVIENARKAMSQADRLPPVPIVDVAPPGEDGEMPIDELIEQRISACDRKRSRAQIHRRTLELPPEPLGVAVFGDPHVDNEGCDWRKLMEHVRIVQRTEGVLAACVGDMQDNWVGRLQRLYSKASMTASDGWRLSQWLLESMQWLALVGGNHDQWAHAPGHDPLKWLSRDAEVMCYAPDEIRLSLQWKGRELEPLVWILRHDFPGRSWFHTTHGPNKEAMLDGRCHLLTAGHLHTWGQLSTEQRHGRVTHAFRVRGYKRADQYAMEKNFPEQTHGEAAMVVIDPNDAGPGRSKIFWDMEHGADYLTFLRGRK